MTIAVITEERMRQIGIALDHVYVDIDNAWGNQCWDAANYINSIFGLPQIDTGGAGRWPGWAGNMVDAFPQNAAVAEAFELLPPSVPGISGDTYVWGDSNKEWYPSTHVANLVVDYGTGWGLFLSQNSSLGRPDLPGYSGYSSGPIIFQTLPIAGLIGIIRPRTEGSLTYAGETITPQEDTLSQQEAFDIKQFVQKVIQEERATIVNEIRANTAAVPGAVLNAEIPRGGGQPGSTSLAAVASWHDAHIVAVIDAVSKATGADVGLIKQAVLDGLAQGVKVTVSVEGAEAA